MIYRQEKEKRRGIPKRGLSNAKHKRFEVTDERKKDIKTNRIVCGPIQSKKDSLNKCN